MEIKILQNCRELSGEYEKDETYDVDDKIGKKLIAFNYAVEVKKSTKTEKAEKASETTKDD